ncbi:helix-turn-helix domain-containing protein [Chryseobacterium herbae]|uniref:Helix-turn-helix domain-containing protein n=1 Tax=Chryseobacterium herbae TaxID=2976476 RepID=A0ABT2IYG7_9FLAO|nr:helix-turn-helix domain-containing protein [Chryseobacterium sp. pc1-10]MCT2563898.1 helix-turn-helix domain-containing protein [Chryseobacterium sp. pc1-10]
MKNIPDYKKIYTDLINERYPEKKEAFKMVLSKKNFSVLDVIECNSILENREDKSTFTFNQKHRSFDQQSILEILDYQKKHSWNNSQLSEHFKLSRNTIAKWKKKFL